MKLVAKRGDGVYLVETEPGKGRVLDTEQGQFFPAFNIHSILARGYWEAFEEDDALLQKLLLGINDLENTRLKDIESYLEQKIGTARSGNWGHTGRPGIRGGSGAGGGTVINAPTNQHGFGYPEHAEPFYVNNDYPCHPEWLSETERIQRFDYENTYRQRIVRYSGADSFEEYCNTINNLLAEQIKDVDVCMRVEEYVLDDMLNGSGRYKTQFEVENSNGYYNPTARSALEYNIFGTSDLIPDNLRPAYGYLRKAGDGRECDNLDHYGAIVLTLKKEVRNRTTFTIGDSLDETGCGREQCFAPQPVNAPSYKAVTVKKGLTALGDYKNYMKPPLKFDDELYTYPEAQIHGGVSIDDIKSITITRRRAKNLFGEALSDVLAETTNKGIEWVFKDYDDEVFTA